MPSIRKKIDYARLISQCEPGKSWQCPFCGQHTTLRDEDIYTDTISMEIKNQDYLHSIVVCFVVCANRTCKKATLMVAALGVGENDRTSNEYVLGHYGGLELMNMWKLIPESSAKIYPDYIPLAIREDYTQACLIQYNSAKASAALARRCLQGIIRDFWKITRKRLIDELNAVQDKVARKLWGAMCALKDVGNIGAHMEKDVDVIIDVTPDEADALIKLIELLLEETYIDQHDRNQRIDKVVQIAKDKHSEKNTKAGADSDRKNQ